MNAWNKFEIKRMKGYHDLYLECDVILSADVFEKFRKNNLKNNGLCPSSYIYFYVLSALALSMTKIEFELIPNPGMYLFFEKGMRSAFFYTSKNYSKANNKHLKSYDPNKNQNILYT